MKTTYITCDGCGKPWPGVGDGGTPPGWNVEIHLEGRSLYSENPSFIEPLHFCSKACLHLWSSPDHQRVQPYVTRRA